MHHRLLRLLPLLALAPLAACANHVDQQPQTGPLRTAFHEASLESGVPEEMLLAVGYLETRWRMHDVVDDGEHRPTAGMMAIDASQVEKAARFLGIDPRDAATVPEANVKVAAEVLRELGADVDGHTPKSIFGWRNALDRYVGVTGYADDVFHQMDIGADAVSSTGERLVLPGRGKGTGTRAKEQALTADSSLAVQFAPARDDHWHAGRAHAVDRVVIHTTEGSYAGTIGWFQSAANTYQTSAHYVIRSSDGEITQMVHEQDTAYHVLNWNERAVGIEHEAMMADPSWFTDAMYEASAALVREICARWNIPMDREHIVGHVEVPGNDHQDPGHYWDWDRYMALVNNGAPPPDPCNGVDYNGSCDGATLTWCENNALHSVDCATTAQPACGWQDDTVGNNCIAAPAPTPTPPPANDPPPPPSSSSTDACAGLDYAGACNGAVLTWCENGAVKTFDCASTNQACGFQDDTVGNNCVAAAPADPCAGVSYAGTCDGATLTWCENGALQTFDCASTNQSCGWQDDAVGNNCL